MNNNLSLSNANIIFYSLNAKLYPLLIVSLMLKNVFLADCTTKTHLFENFISRITVRQGTRQTGYFLATDVTSSIIAT